MRVRLLRSLAIAAVWLAAATGARAAGTDRLLDELVRARAPGFAYDFAGVMSGENRARISRVLGELEAKTGAQVKVVAVKSLDGGEINDFATRLYERWGIGTKGKDDGVLLLAAIADRKVRVEVGYGLEDVLPDAKTGRLLDEHVLPRFRAGDFGGGLEAGALAIAAAIATSHGVTLGTAPPAAYGRPRPGDGSIDRIPTPILILMGIVFVYMAIRHPQILIWMLLSSGGRGGGGGFGGSGFGGFGGGRSGGGGATRGW